MSPNLEDGPLLTTRADVVAWLAALTAVLLFPPPGLAEAFRGDLHEPFLRQLLPVDNLRLLVAGSLPSLALLYVGAAAALLIQSAALPSPGSAALVVFVVGLLLALCSGAGLVRVPALWGLRIPYQAWAAVGPGGMAYVGSRTGSLPLACLAGLAAAGAIAAAVGSSPRIASE